MPLDDGSPDMVTTEPYGTRDASGASNVPGRPGRRAAGFTLVELLIALAMMSILAAVAIPNLGIGRHQAEAAMQTVGSDLLAAQRLAITRQHDVVVMFDAGNRTIRIAEDDDNDGVIEAGEHVTAHSIGDGVVFGHGSAAAHPIGGGPITFTETTDGLPSVTFHRDGSASEAGGVYLQSSRDAARDNSLGARLLTVDRATGRPNWYRYADGAWQRGF